MQLRVVIPLCLTRLLHVVWNSEVQSVAVKCSQVQLVAGSTAGIVQEKHQAEAQGQHSATAEQLERVDITDSDTTGAAPQQRGDQQRGDVLDPGSAQHSGVSALTEHVLP